MLLFRGRALEATASDGVSLFAKRFSSKRPLFPPARPPCVHPVGVHIPYKGSRHTEVWIPVLYSTRKGDTLARGFPRSRLMSNVYINDLFSVSSRPRRARPGLRPHRDWVCREAGMHRDARGNGQIQGYLGQKKPPPLLALPLSPRHRPTGET